MAKVEREYDVMILWHDDTNCYPRIIFFQKKLSNIGNAEIFPIFTKT